MTPRPQIGLLDTSVVIDLPRMAAQDLPAFPTISAITLAELGVGPHVAANARTRQQRQLVLQQAEASFDALPFDDACARRFSLVAASLRESGRKTKARAFDALIAATALANDLPLYTRNPSDFINIEGLEVHSVEQ